MMPLLTSSFVGIETPATQFPSFHLHSLRPINSLVQLPWPSCKSKTGRVSQPITDAAHATGRDRSWIATRPLCYWLTGTVIITSFLKNLALFSVSK